MSERCPFPRAPLTPHRRNRHRNNFFFSVVLFFHFAAFKNRHKQSEFQPAFQEQDRRVHDRGNAKNDGARCDWEARVAIPGPANVGYRGCTLFR